MSKLTMVEQPGLPLPLPDPGKWFLYIAADGLHQVDEFGNDTALGAAVAPVDVSQTQILYVDKDRAAGAPTGNLNAPYTTIQAAINAVPADTATIIYVAPAPSTSNVYDEDLTIEGKSITLIFASPISLGTGAPARGITLRGTVTSRGELQAFPAGRGLMGSAGVRLSISGSITFDDNAGTTLGGRLRLSEVTVNGGLVEAVGYDTGNGQFELNGVFSDDIVLPNCHSIAIRDCSLESVAVYSFLEISRTSLKGLVFSVSDSPTAHKSGHPSGLFMCSFSAASPLTWDGVGSASFVVGGVKIREVSVDDYTFRSITDAPVTVSTNILLRPLRQADPIFGRGTTAPSSVIVSTSMSSNWFVENLTIQAGATLTTNGYFIFVRDTLILEGTIANRGGDTANNKGASGAGAGGPVLYLGSDGGDGATGGTPNGNAGISSSGFCASGGQGGDTVSGTGGAGGVTVDAGLICKGSLHHALFGLDYNGTPLQSGSGGGGGAATALGGTGGGGGGGGGIIGVVARRMLFGPTATFDASGGNGADGQVSPGGGGGGGGGGAILVAYEAIAGANPTLNVSGGSPGAGNGGDPGLAGSSGSVLVYLVR